MKVAISIPDPLFKAADRISKNIRMSRSRFYANAVEAFVKAHSGEEVTKRLNDVYSEHSSKAEPSWEAASLEVLRREKW